MKSNIWSISVEPANGDISVAIFTKGANDPVRMKGSPLVMQGVVNSLVAGLCIGEMNNNEGVMQ